jgi:hypothetical protein
MLDGDVPGVRILPGVPHGDEAALMTEMADEIKIKITMYPDRADIRYNTDIEKMRKWCRDYLGPVGPMVVSGQKGKMLLFGNGIELEFEHTGLQELPELTGGDN